MNLSSHLSQLRQKHETLARQIEDEQSRPSADDLAISELKRKKLMLKDEIARLGGETQH